MPDTASLIETVNALAPQIAASVDESERARRLSLPLVKAMAHAGLFRLWIPRAFGGGESEPMTLVQVVEEVARIDGAVGWCLANGGGLGAFGGYLPVSAAREIYGSDPYVITAGAFRPAGQAVVSTAATRSPQLAIGQRLSTFDLDCRRLPHLRRRSAATRGGRNACYSYPVFSSRSLRDYRHLGQHRIAWHRQPRLCGQ